ncbi:hypothetical protein [Actinomadura macrotermitis]|uniref:Uncharacterized protein n=1 Tax=Actinomadura macrotermitis TaxID=2585200 RepID=A0A7K0C338_9ACTN|nr:hypothetical protein [Actinomadura macrotermitis]MQY07512.1 hypothetical protein [Actinomadura macrotermitis]
MTDRRVVLALIAIGAVGLAVVSGTITIRVATEAITGPLLRPLGHDQVERGLRGRPEITPAASPVPGAGRTHFMATRAGRVLVRCVGRDRIVLAGWSPGLGYAGLPREPGPGARVAIEFRGADGTYRIIAACTNSVPRLLE